MPGLRAYTSPAGIRVIELDWWANPLHTQEWATQQRKVYTTSRQWRREMERDWSSPDGDPFLPEFSELGREHFVHIAPRMMAGPVYRSYDLGRRRPACTWFQYSPKSNRVWLLREFMPHELQTHEFRDAVLYLSGELPRADTPDRALQWVDRYAAKPSHSHLLEPPWFPLGTRFIDISGKEALQGSANAPTKEEGVAADIFRAGGINLGWVNPRVEGRYQVLRSLLHLYKDGFPGLIIDPQCEEVIELMDGALSYPKKTEAKSLPDKPRDDGHFINLADALTYGIVAVVPLKADEPPKPPVFLGYKGREEVFSDERKDRVPWYENR